MCLYEPIAIVPYLTIRCIYILSIWRVSIRRWRPLLSAAHGKSKKKVVAYSSERRNRILLPSSPSHIFRITRGCMHANHFPSSNAVAHIMCPTSSSSTTSSTIWSIHYLRLQFLVVCWALSLFRPIAWLFMSLYRVWPSEHPWMDGCDAIRYSGEWVSSDSTIFSIQESSWRSTEMRCPAMLAPHTILCAHTQFIHRGNFAIVIGMPFDPSFSVCMRNARIYYVCEASDTHTCECSVLALKSASNEKRLCSCCASLASLLSSTRQNLKINDLCWIVGTARAPKART